MSDFKVVVPARFGSSRLPGKPLADIDGVPMVVHVVRRALRSGAAEVVIATDDDRVRAAAEQAGCDVQMTRTDHASGSDRVMEVATAREWPQDTVVVNVQGDEPLIPPEVIAQVAGLLDDDPLVAVATLCEPIVDRAAVFDPNVVKVVAGADGFARYFSRAPVPYARDAFGDGMRQGPLPAGTPWWRHIGIYGYRLAALARFVALPVGTLERAESLEQLRLVEAGIGIRIAPAAAAVPGGVDTAEDLERVRRLVADAR